MTEDTARSLSRGVFSLAKTKRKKWLWCAWWTAEPREKPFQPPDAHGGGARTEEEARRMAEHAAGRPLEPIDGHWAGAWKRVLAGLKPFPARSARIETPKNEKARPIDPYALLGITSEATLEEVKAAFRREALLHHPDRGGEPAAFMQRKRAYDSIVKRRERQPSRARRA